jgi:hypothetical protein
MILLCQKEVFRVSAGTGLFVTGERQGIVSWGKLLRFVIVMIDRLDKKSRFPGKNRKLPAWALDRR